MLGGTGIHQPVFTRQQIAAKGGDFSIGVGGLFACYYMEGTTASWLIRLLLLLAVTVPVTFLPTVPTCAGGFLFLVLVLRFPFELGLSLLLVTGLGGTGDGVG